jgi:hypothetical protein
MSDYKIVVSPLTRVTMQLYSGYGKRMNTTGVTSSSPPHLHYALPNRQQHSKPEKQRICKRNESHNVSDNWWEWRKVHRGEVAARRTGGEECVHPFSDPTLNEISPFLLV